MTIINNLNTCHYCIDTILKLNEEYDILYKELQGAYNIIKKQNYINCLSCIPKAKQLLNDIYDTEIENNEIEIAKEYIFNPKNFINLIKQLDDYQELQDLR